MKSNIHVAQRASSLLYFYLKNLPEDKNVWILPANVCPIVVATFLKANKKVTFADIDLNTLSFDIERLKQLLACNINVVQGVLWVRAYGHTIENLEHVFQSLRATSSEIKIIDDACLMAPNFNPVLQQADIMIFSTGYSKYVDVGYGGWAITRDALELVNYNFDFKKEDYNIVVKLFESSIKTKQIFVLPDNSWLDLRKPQFEIEEYFKDIKKRTQQSKIHKEKLNNIYKKHLGHWAFPETHHQWRFNLMVEKRDYVLAKIFDAGHFASKNYPSLVNIFSTGTDENARLCETKILNLFNDFRYTEERALELAKLIRNELET
jgi:hypothetical protein